ncbi:MAG: hypothetical protein JJT88_09430 [Gammaproteobacteria bacterium]|nr:hypothetical protein [Gammaproteobacteria bacterium]
MTKIWSPYDVEKSPLDRVLLDQAPALAAGIEPALTEPERPERVFGDALDATPPGADPNRTCVVHFQRGILEQLSPAAVMELELPLLGGRYRLLINEVMGSIAQGRVLRGRLLEDGRCRASTITLGEDRAYGTLVAPRGILEFEAKGSVAWLFVTPHRPAPPRRRAWLLPKHGSSQVG